MTDREEFLEIFRTHVTRPGSEKLLDWMDSKTDFFSAPASTRFHGACEGGLCAHSLNVYRVLHGTFFTPDEDSEETFAICALLHDLCKANFYKKGTRNVKNEATGQWEKVPSYSVEDMFPYGHGEKSVFLIERFMKLKVEEAVAIRWHMGGFDDAVRGGSFAVIAGPCSIESEEQITYCAQRVKAAGASLLRGGAFKPRTSPYSFQGMRSEGLDLLKLARRATGSPIVTEIMNTEHLPLFENVDLIQVGARNMQNFELLKAVGRQKKPVLLKRGLANTLEEFVMSAEYIMAEGNENVILCERGIRTFETSMRNTLDLAGVVMLHKMTHLPVIVDPSHACGHAWMVPQLAKAAVAAGADGLMIEVHNDPAKAKCDGAQSLTPDQFDELMGFIRKEVEFFGKKMN